LVNRIGLQSASREVQERRMSGRLTSIVQGRGRVLAFTAGGVLLSFAAAHAALTISETGSTLILPLFKSWVAAYAKVDPDLQMTVGATGSEAGIAQAIAKQVQIGTSDAYMSDNEAMANPHILNIPLAISAQTVVANLPELRGATLKLSGPVLAGIYSGTIREWDAAPIAAINQGVHLPHHAIVPVRRADGSGDTFVFTQFLTFSTPDQQHLSSRDFNWEGKIGYGTTVQLALGIGRLTASGNQGMVQTIASTPYRSAILVRASRPMRTRPVCKPRCWKTRMGSSCFRPRPRLLRPPPCLPRARPPISALPGVRSGGRFLPPDQLRIRGRLDHAAEPAGCVGHQQFPALVHRAARRRRAELPRTGTLHCVADTHPCAQ
jgi:ABC-type phosphate transport system substrate-binding protein